MTVSNPPTLTSVISEFGVGGGSPNNLYAYRRGGGIIPDLPKFYGVGYGTPESPLQLSQFAGLTKYLDIQNCVSGDYFYYDYYNAYWVHGYSTSFNIGYIDDGTSNVSTPTPGLRITEIVYNTGNNIFALVMDGYSDNDGWTKMNLGPYSYYREKALYSFGTEYPYGRYTRWWWNYEGGIPAFLNLPFEVTWE